MAKGRVKKEVRDEICNWIEAQVKKLTAKGTDANGEPVTEMGAVQAAVDMASEHFGYRSPTIGGWYQEDKMGGKSLPKKKAGRKKKAGKASGEAPAAPKAKGRRGRPRKVVAGAPAAARPASMEDEAYAVIGELVLAKDGLGTLDREVLIAVGKRHLEWRAKDRELAELRSRKGKA